MTRTERILCSLFWWTALVVLIALWVSIWALVGVMVSL